MSEVNVMVEGMEENRAMKMNSKHLRLNVNSEVCGGHESAESSHTDRLRLDLRQSSVMG